MASEFTWPVRVYYEDTDAGGVVYYANYLRFMERARTEWLRAKGFEQDELREQGGIVFAVRQVQLDYLRPARFNQALEVSVALRETGRVSLSLDQEVRDPHGKACCRGRVKLACVDVQRFRPAPIPPDLMRELIDVE
jgi:acyl-CoA thioester hydrolase